MESIGISVAQYPFRHTVSSSWGLPFTVEMVLTRAPDDPPITTRVVLTAVFVPRGNSRPGARRYYRGLRYGILTPSRTTVRKNFPGPIDSIWRSQKETSCKNSAWYSERAPKPINA